MPNMAGDTHKPNALADTALIDCPELMTP